MKNHITVNSVSGNGNTVNNYHAPVQINHYHALAPPSLRTIDTPHYCLGCGKQIHNGNNIALGKCWKCQQPGKREELEMPDDDVIEAPRQIAAQQSAPELVIIDEPRRSRLDEIDANYAQLQRNRIAYQETEFEHARQFLNDWQMRSNLHTHTDDPILTNREATQQAIWNGEYWEDMG